MLPNPLRAWNVLREDLETARRRDPAARSKVEVALTYPGVHALWSHRVAHSLWIRGARLPARVLSAGARVLTGVDIHPGAQLGRRLFIDHATGVVIGETAEVGEDVVIFHGVTLGGVSMSPGKRHPTVGSHVLLGAGAKVLGPVIVGDDAKIGANAVVTKDVPAGSVALGVPARVRPTSRPQEPDADLIVDPNLYAEDPSLYI
jgi:serine O-acetyltransferase